MLVLTTSNVTEAIDGAFIDRSDLKIYIGPSRFTPRGGPLKPPQAAPLGPSGGPPPSGCHIHA